MIDVDAFEGRRSLVYDPWRGIDIRDVTQVEFERLEGGESPTWAYKYAQPTNPLSPKKKLESNSPAISASTTLLYPVK